LRVSCFTAVFVVLSACRLAAAPPITSLAFSPDTKQIVAASEEALTVYEARSLKVLRTQRLRLPKATCLVFSPHGKQMAIAGGTPAEWGGIHVFDWPLQEEPELAMRSIGDDALLATTWLDDDRLAVASTDGGLFAIDSAGKLLRQFKGHSRHVLCVAALDDGRTLISGGADASLRVWNAETGALVRTLSNHTAAVRALAVRPQTDGPAMVASAGADKTVRLWQPAIGRLVRFARLESAPLAITWTPNGDALLAACEDGRLRVIDPATMKVIQDSPAIDGWAYAVTASADGQIAVVGGESGQMRVLQLGSAAEHVREH
jgi:WD40 repeat protein